jgi:hypothetical protein
VSQQTTNRSFDDLARALAEGSISRRRALKLFAGTAIAALIPSRAMAAITCPPGTVKICHVPQRADGTCRRGEAETRCVTEEQAARHAAHPCDCCGGCGGTDNCREPRPRTCFSTTPMCIPDGGPCSSGSDCCSGLVCKGPSGQRTCAASCIPSSAISCDPLDFNSCGGLGSPCSCNSAAEGGTYCETNGTSIPCSTSCDCPAGQFCHPFGTGGLCTIAATVCPVG